MSKPPDESEIDAMNKHEDCVRCGNFSGYEDEGFLVCAMHPAGPEETPCPDFDLVEDDWFLFSSDYVNGELVLAQSSFLEAIERNIQIAIHPRLTGRCPECGDEFDLSRSISIYWDCDRCGWMDDCI